MIVLLSIFLPVILAIDITDCPKEPLVLNDATVYNIKTTNCVYKFAPSAFVFAKIDPDGNYKNCEQCFSLDYNTYYYNHTDRVSGQTIVPPVSFQLSVDASKVPSFDIRGLLGVSNSIDNTTMSLYRHYATIIRVNDMKTNSLLTATSISSYISLRVGYRGLAGVFFFYDDQYLSSSVDVFKMQKTLGPLVSPGRKISFLSLNDPSTTDLLTSFLVNIERYDWGVAMEDVSIEEISSANTSLAFAYHDKPRLVYLLNGVNPLDSTLQVINVGKPNVKYAQIISFHAGCATTRLLENTVGEISTVSETPSREIDLRGLCKTILIPANISMLAVAVYPNLDRQNKTLPTSTIARTVLTKTYPYPDQFADTRTHEIQINMGVATSVIFNAYFGIDSNDNDCFNIKFLDTSIASRKYCPSNATYNQNIVLYSSFVISDAVAKNTGGYYFRYWPSFSSISSTSKSGSSSTSRTSVTKSPTTQASTKTTKKTNAPISDSPTIKPDPIYPTTSRYESTTSYSHNTGYTLVSFVATAYLISLLQ